MNSFNLLKQRRLKNILIYFLFLSLITLIKCQPDNPEESDTVICGGFLKFSEDYPELKKQLDYSKLPSHLQTHNNKKSFLDRYSVVNPDGCCHTVVAHLSKDGHYYIYPTPNPTVETARSITVREAARIQSFDDCFVFYGSKVYIRKQIGNAVPPLLAKAIADQIAKTFDLV